MTLLTTPIKTHHGHWRVCTIPAVLLSDASEAFGGGVTGGSGEGSGGGVTVDSGGGSGDGVMDGSGDGSVGGIAGGSGASFTGSVWFFAVLISSLVTLENVKLIENESFTDVIDAAVLFSDKVILLVGNTHNLAGLSFIRNRTDTKRSSSYTNVYKPFSTSQYSYDSSLT